MLGIIVDLICQKAYELLMSFLPFVAAWGENKCSHLEDVGVRCRGPDMTKTCEASCGDGYFNSGDNKCSECPPDCKTCSSLDNCTSCIEKRFLEGIKFIKVKLKSIHAASV